MTQCRATVQGRGRYAPSRRCSRQAIEGGYFCRQHLDTRRTVRPQIGGRYPSGRYTPEQIMTISPDFSMNDIRSIQHRQGVCRTAEICLEAGIPWTPNFAYQGIQPYIEYFENQGESEMAQDLRMYYRDLSFIFSSAHPECNSYAPLPETNSKWQTYLRNYIQSCEPYMEEPEGYQDIVAEREQAEALSRYAQELVDVGRNLSRGYSYPENAMDYHRNTATRLGRNFDDDLAAAQEFAQQQQNQYEAWNQAYQEWQQRFRQDRIEWEQEWQENNPAPSRPEGQPFILDA